MGESKMRVEWADAVTLHVGLDVTDRSATQLRRSGESHVQLLVGRDQRVLAYRSDAAAATAATPGSVVDSVIGVEIVSVPVATSSGGMDDTVLTHDENAVEDTVLGQPAFDSETADTIIGALTPTPSVTPPAAPPVSPPMARLAVRFPDGRVVALDRVVYVGRSPRSARITSGAVPELIAVPSPLREISSSHLEIEEQGGTVVVRDLGSTNGTRVTVPGAPRGLLLPGDSRVVPIGTLLDLGDSTILEIVPLAPAGASW